MTQHSIVKSAELPPLEIDPQVVLRDGFPAAVGYSPRSRRDPRAVAPEHRMAYFPVFLRRCAPKREHGTIRFRQFIDRAPGGLARRVQEVALAPAGGPTFVLMRYLVEEDDDLGAIAFLAAPDAASGEVRWSRRASRGDAFEFDLRFPYEAGPGERVALLGVHPSELSRRTGCIAALGEVTGWRPTSFDEHVVHGVYWHRLASGVLAPHSGSLNREVTVTGADEATLFELGAISGLELDRGRRFEPATVEARLRALHGPGHHLRGCTRTETYLFEASERETFWAVYGLYTAFGLEAPHLRRVFQQIEQRPVTGLTLADLGYRFELERPGIPSLLGGEARLPCLEGESALTAQAVIEGSDELAAGASLGSRSERMRSPRAAAGGSPSSGPVGHLTSGG